MPPLNPILLRLRAQLQHPEGGARLSRADVLELAARALEAEELRPWTKHARDCSRWSEKVLERRICTCGLEAAEERARGKRKAVVGVDTKRRP